MQEFEEYPCVTVEILNAYTFRSAIEMVREVKDGDGDVEIRFYKDKFLIEDFSQNGCKFCKIAIKKKDLYHYSFNAEGELYLSAIVNITEFMTCIKADKKRSAVFEIYCSRNTSTCAICFSRDRSCSSMDRITGRYEMMHDFTDRIDDPYKLVYSNLEANSILDEKELSENLNIFKTNKQACVSFSLMDSGRIKLEAKNQSRSTIADLRVNPNYPFSEQEESSLWTVIENVYEILLSHDDILQLCKIVKLGSYNVIRIYMSIDYPLLFHTKLLNYGTFSIWYKDKNFS